MKNSRLFSFHGGHSGKYCDHAAGDLRDLVQSALNKKFSHYGLSEHMPRARVAELYPEEIKHQRTPQQLLAMFRAYFLEARALQIEFNESLHLLVGFETEWIQPDDKVFIDGLKAQFQPDFIVGSVHHVQTIPIDYGNALYTSIENDLGGTEALFCAYYDAQWEMLQQIQPEIVGHFDLIRIYRPQFELTPTIWEKIKRNLHYAIQYGAVFEVNSRAFSKGLTEPYPNAAIIQIILELGGRLSLGDDSHHPSEVGTNFARLLTFLNQIHVECLYCLEKSSKGGLNYKIIPLSVII